MRKKYGIQIKGLGRALRPSGIGTLRPKPTGRGGKPLKPKPMRPGKKDGGKVKKKFPDLTGDGKVTRADVLKGRGVFAAGGKVPENIKKRFKKNPNIKEKILPKKKKNRLEELRKELG